jgi:hypothetical protein
METKVPLTENTSETTAQSQALSCPVHTPTQKRFVDPDDELVLLMHKRVVVQYTKDTYGKPELRLFYDDKEISFDEPELFGFGETLAKQSRFVARSATQWVPGQTWPRMQGLLEQLIEEGVLRYAEDAADEKIARTTEDGARPSPLPPAQAMVARSWQECEAITRELAGRPLELGYLELVIPIFRVVHMSLDADGRQVGEANVFPKAMRLDIPTNWRACIYPGTRHLDPKPMNVTALKGMRVHWGQMMRAVLRIREAFLRRFPEARKGWTVGHLERLSAAVLAVPTYQVMRTHNPVENGKLHPALSSLFRVTDGVRMTMHQMLFIPIGEPTTLPDAPMNSQEILDYAERNYSFHSEFGVCAGPRAMMEEFLGVLVDGTPARNDESVVLDREVEAALDEVEFAIDYGLYGLQAYASVFSLWPIMTRTYERLWEIALAWQADSSTPAVTEFVERMRGILESLKTVTYLGAEQWRVDRQKVYADMYQQCGRGLHIEEHAQSLTERIAPRRDARLMQVEQQMRDILSRHFQYAQGAGEPHLEKFLACTVDYFSQEQAILQVACATQRHINALLGRMPPKRPFSASDIDIHVLLQGRDARQVPYLGGELQAILGIGIVINHDRIAITENAANP